MLLAVPFFVTALGGSVVLAVICAVRASFTSEPRTRLHRLRLSLLTVFLHLLQPLARLAGRLRHGLTPWRHRGVLTLSAPRPWLATIWSERWQAPETWLRSIESVLKMHGAVVLRGGDFDRWDLEVRGGLLGQVRARTVVEDHGSGKQFVRFRTWPRYSRAGLVLTVLLLAFSVGAALDSSWAAAALLFMTAALLGLRAVWESATATATVMHVFRTEEIGERS